jgi:signal transduction histidine kinase
VERKRRKDLSFIVHDLKMPISAVATATYLIDKKFAMNIAENPVVSQMVDILRRNAALLNKHVMEIINQESRLQALISEAPDLALNLRDIDLWPIAERLKDDCQSIADSRSNTIHNKVPRDLRLYADPDLLLEVLRNLLSNALKYTTNGDIVIGGVEYSDSTACWVKDTGIGIRPERLKLIFQKQTADPNVPESTGLGLAIVRKVVQLHDGKITVESMFGAGSSFRVEFPRPESKAA